MKLFLQLIIAFAVCLQAMATEKQGATDQKSKYGKDKTVQHRYSSTIIYSDDFNGDNDTASLHQRGYITVYNGTGPQNGPTWFQGEPILFESYNGPEEGYLAADFNVVADSNRIDSWLILPEMGLNSGDSLSFYCRSNHESIYRDSLKVMYSASGNPDINSPDWMELGFFKTDTTGVWERKAFTAPSGGTSARFAIRYFLNSGGPLGTSSDYVGIDQLTVSAGVVAREEEVQKQPLSVYPNPASTAIRVSHGAITGTVLIYNSVGQEVLRQEADLIGNEINVAHLPAGLYTIMVLSGSKVGTGKFVKQ